MQGCGVRRRQRSSGSNLLAGEEAAVENTESSFWSSDKATIGIRAYDEGGSENDEGHIGIFLKTSKAIEEEGASPVSGSAEEVPVCVQGCSCSELLRGFERTEWVFRSMMFASSAAL